MAKKRTKTPKYIKSFCSYIDELIEAWNTADDVNYRIILGEPGAKANFFAIKLGLATLDGDLPYEQEKWRHNSTAKGAKEKWPERTKELRGWKKRAKALSTNSKILILPIETDITKEKIDKFIRTADEAIDIQRYSGDTLNYGSNQQICIKGQTVNALALELGLIDPDWYLANKFGLFQHKSIMRYSDSREKDNQKLYKELEIDPACGKLPFVFTDLFNRNGHIYEDELQLLVKRATAQLEPKTEVIPSEYKTSPTTLIRLVESWGGDMSMSKLRTILKNKSIAFEKLGRETYVFDKRDLPVHVINKLND